MTMQRLFCSMGMQHEFAYTLQHRHATWMCSMGMLLLGFSKWIWMYMNECKCIYAVYLMEVVLMDMQYKYAVSILRHGHATWMCNIYVAAWVCNMRMNVYECIHCICSAFYWGSTNEYAIWICSVYFAAWACNMNVHRLCCSLSVQHEKEYLWMYMQCILLR